jgi:hypothetical protein
MPGIRHQESDEGTPPRRPAQKCFARPVLNDKRHNLTCFVIAATEGSDPQSGFKDFAKSKTLHKG